MSVASVLEAGARIALIVAILAAILALVLYFTRSLSIVLTTPQIIIEPFAVPTQLADRGYSGEVVARRVHEELGRIGQPDAGAGFVVRPTAGGLELWGPPPELRHPVLDLGTSAWALLGALPDLRRGDRIGGEVMADGPDRLAFRLRVNGEAVSLEPREVAGIGFDELARKMARAVVLRELEKDRVEELRFRGREAMIEMKYALAAIYFEQAFRASEERSGDALSQLGLALASQGRYEDAIASYERVDGDALELKDKVFHYNNWGLALANTGQYEAALQKYDQALRSGPDNANTLTNKGLALANLAGTLRNAGDAAVAGDKFQEAFARYRAAIELDPTNPAIYHNWGLALANFGDHQEALAKYQIAASLEPPDADLHHSWGLALANTAKTLASAGDTAAAHEKYREAIARYRDALRLAPHDPAILTSWSLSLADLGDEDGAARMRERAERLRRGGRSGG